MVERTIKEVSFGFASSDRVLNVGLDLRRKPSLSYASDALVAVPVLVLVVWRASVWVAVDRVVSSTLACLECPACKPHLATGETTRSMSLLLATDSSGEARVVRYTVEMSLMTSYLPCGAPPPLLLSVV